MRMPFTDHHIQDKIIFGLVEGKTRFSELVPEDMEHSLFMYHMKKLIRDGIVIKDDQTYKLTLEGAKLYNSRYRLARPLRQPTLLIQFVVIQDDKILVSRRTTVLQNDLNEYMLPTGAHSFLSTSIASARTTAKARGLKLGEYFCSVETIAKERTFHGIIDVYTASFDKERLVKGDHEQVWLPLEDLISMDFSKAGSAPFIVGAYQKGLQNTRLLNIVS